MRVECRQCVAKRNLVSFRILCATIPILLFYYQFVFLNLSKVYKGAWSLLVSLFHSRVS